MPRFWISRLFDVIYPRALVVGQKEALEVDPAHNELLVIQGIKVLCEWMEDCFFNLGQWYQGFASTLVKLFLLATGREISP
jgi:hypothetical protein